MAFGGKEKLQRCIELLAKVRERGSPAGRLPHGRWVLGGTSSLAAR
jgi:hypothetical protein